MHVCNKGIEASTMVDARTAKAGEQWKRRTANTSLTREIDEAVCEDTAKSVELPDEEFSSVTANFVSYYAWTHRHTRSRLT